MICNNEKGNYYDFDQRRYWVKFFDANETTSSWVSARQINEYSLKHLEKSNQSLKIRMKKRIEKAIEWSEYVKDWDLKERLDYFQDTNWKVKLYAFFCDLK